jgi:hypothetical protein
MIVRRPRVALGIGLAAMLIAPAAAPAAKSTNICIASTGSNGWCGDGLAATKAKLALPRDVAPLADGGYLIADSQSHVIRRVDASGRITTVAGSGVGGFPAYGKGAGSNFLGTPSGVAPLPGGGYLIADSRLGEIVRVTPDGRFAKAAGQDPGATAGDGGRATDARLRSPRDIAVMPDGAYAIADSDDNRVRLVLTDGRIVTLAGTGVAGFSGDGGPAALARLSQPTALSPAPDGSLLVADRGNARIRRISPEGTITTVVGGGFGDTPALQATLAFPTGVAATADGGLLVAEAASVRKVGADGSIQPLAGTGMAGYNVLRSPAGSVALAYPTAIAALSDGRALIADTLNDRVRLLDPLAATLKTVAGRGVPGPPGTPEPAPTVTLDPPPPPVAGKPIVTTQLDPAGTSSGAAPPAPPPAPPPPSAPGPPSASAPPFVAASSRPCASPNDPDPVGFSDFYILPHGKTSLKVGRKVTFQVQLSASAKLVATVTRSGKVVRKLTRSLKASSGRSLSFKKTVKPGSYRLALQATSKYGRRCAGLKVTVKQ